MGTIKTFGDEGARSLEQLERCMAAGDTEFGVLCADHHPGYSQPIGGGIAYVGYAARRPPAACDAASAGRARTATATASSRARASDVHDPYKD